MVRLGQRGRAETEIDGKVHPEGAGWVRKLTYREP
jgi:hypothetical protein